MIRVRLLVQSPALQAGVRALLSADTQIIVLDDADDSAEAFQQKDDADVVITTSASFDLDSEDSPRLPARAPAVLLTNASIDFRRLITAGHVRAVLPLDVSADELCAAVRALAAGLVVASPPLLATTDDSTGAHGPLTAREAEILGLLSRGLANKQIALELGISEHTVKFHVSAIYTKLNAANRTQAMREGLRNGWIVL